MQISTRKDDYIVDALNLRHELHVLNEVFTDPAIVKVNNCIFEWKLIRMKLNSEFFS